MISKGCPEEYRLCKGVSVAIQGVPVANRGVPIDPSEERDGATNHELSDK